MNRVINFLLIFLLSSNAYAANIGSSSGGTGDMKKSTYDTDANGVVDTSTALAANGSNCSSGSFPLGVDASGASESCTALSSSNAGTASALAANGTNCSAGNYALGVDAAGNAEGCTSVGSGSGETNTASNLGGGLANYSTKVGVDLQFNSFTASDFNLASNLISIDYTNGQAAASGTKGFLTGADWDTFNGKQATITWGAGLANTGATGRTDSTEADFLTSGALTCGSSTQGKMKVHTTPLQYCDNAATPALQYAAYGSSTGVATTATALAANGANCTSQFPLGVDASGASETCTSVANAYVASNAAIDFSKLATLTSAHVLLGNSSNVATDTAVSGDITITNAGVTAIGASKVLGSMIAADTVQATDIDETDNYAFTGTLINDGSNPTVATAGKIGFDTTQNQLLVGASTNVFSPTHTACVTVTDVTSADDNVQFLAAGRDLTVTQVYCRYAGTGTTVATFTLQNDKAATAMTITGTNPTCVKGNNNFSKAAVTANNAIVQGDGVQFSVSNTPNPTTDDYTLCIDYTEDRK